MKTFEKENGDTSKIILPYLLKKNSFDLCKKFFYLFFYFDTINIIFFKSNKR